MSMRMLKINSLMKRELSLIIQQEVKDPRVGFVTVTGVEVSSDLRHAKVHCSVMGTDAQRRESINGLNSAKGYIQVELGSRIKLKFMPELHFKLDTSLDHSMHIQDVLNKIHAERAERGEDAADAGGES
ncbi:MAG TPA: 30S ribosome-binding factor RbfA [bacterium]|nr:30S ribosome-binding factor RbfA [bacterium]